MNEIIAQKLKLLPDSPGCYQMKENGKIIYVGKAVNLKNRVRSYFHGRDHTPKVAAMVSHVDDFDILLCRTNLEALILECNLIKLHRPYYNILLKDDKHYPYIRIDLNEPFPRVTLARRQTADGGKYFGPYIGATAVREVLEALKKLFPLRTCNHYLPDHGPKRPCMNYEIGRCLGPCCGKCTEAEYRAVVQRVLKFLEGKYQDVTAGIEQDMRRAAAALQFEKAARLRDQMRDIQGLMQRQQAIQTSGAEQDVFAVAQDGLDAMAQVMYVRGGRMVGGDAFPLPREGKEDPGEVLFGFIVQFYGDDRRPAREVLCPGLPEEIGADLTEWLRRLRGGAVTLTVPQRGDKRALTLLAEKNARDALEKRNAKKQVHYERTVGAVEELARCIGLDTVPRRIEGYDISNTQGQQNVASMVVFLDGEPAPKEYRHYRIKSFEGANDFAAMNEVLSRRFRRCFAQDEKDRWPLPDLVLIDGGPEQLSFARKAMLEAGADVPMFGLAKRLEEIFLPGREDSILIDHHSPALHLIQRIRDEAHRFAITYHRGLRGKASVHSALEDIPGVGPNRRRALLQYFKSVKAIKEADLEALRKVPGMNAPAAEAVYAWAHPDERENQEGQGRGTV
ncbi:MAG: excinuclease ABC subunit UvrC [Clostridiales bacterium]|nr:excinuclease ABC subunit UvrC [Clostridiales bacterium]